jgi:redox-sensitive bicupin YhaK (pirin superfamily)
MIEKTGLFERPGANNIRGEAVAAATAGGEGMLSWQPADEARMQAASGSLETVIIPRGRDLGGFAVRRALPAAQRRMVGPFVFWDQMGPAVFRPGEGIDVRPHPHIGLATVTYLFAGEILHRDSLGNIQPIQPGEVNWMTAGSGIVHSERTTPQLRATGSSLSGIQSWVALPKREEETAPGFAHHPRAELPLIEDGGVRLRLIAGAAYGARSPVKTFSPMFYADAALENGGAVPLPAEHEERAVYVFDGEVEVASERFAAGRLLVFRPGDAISLRAAPAARLLLLGGDTLDGPRHIWWNFVSSSQERIERAKADWKEGRFARVPGDAEFIPLPE